MTRCIKPKTENIAATLIDGEAVIVNLTTGVYYSMDAIGAEVWAMIEQDLPIGEISESIVARYDVTADEAKKDLESLIEKLVDEDLVAEADEPRSPAAAVRAEGVEDRAAYVAPVLSIYRDMGDLLALDPPMPGLRDIPLKTGLPPGE